MSGLRAERDRVRRLVQAELHDYDPEGAASRRVGLGTPMSPDWHRRTIAEFRGALVEPRRLAVNFSGGGQQMCWSVTRTDGCYRVVYVPSAECFSLAVESRYGPVDIGVHGDALGCFGSV